MNTGTLNTADQVAAECCDTNTLARRVEAEITSRVIARVHAELDAACGHVACRLPVGTVRDILDKIAETPA